MSDASSTPNVPDVPERDSHRTEMPGDSALGRAPLGTGQANMGSRSGTSDTPSVFSAGQIWRHPGSGLLIRIERVEGRTLWCSYPDHPDRVGQRGKGTRPAIRSYDAFGFEHIHELVEQA